MTEDSLLYEIPVLERSCALQSYEAPTYFATSVGTHLTIVLPASPSDYAHDPRSVQILACIDEAQIVLPRRDAMKTYYCKARSTWGRGRNGFNPLHAAPSSQWLVVCCADFPRTSPWFHACKYRCREADGVNRKQEQQPERATLIQYATNTWLVEDKSNGTSRGLQSCAKTSHPRPSSGSACTTSPLDNEAAHPCESVQKCAGW